MSEYTKSLAHSSYTCKYHLVFIPKRRRKVIYGQIRENLGKIFHELARQKDCIIHEGHLMPDHVRMLIEIPPKIAASQAVGFIKGKNAIAIARMQGRQRNFQCENFWARGYHISTVGYEEEKVKTYIREQEGTEKQQDERRF